METKIIKVTDKGQISLPISLRDSLNINKGDELLITRKNDVVIIKKMKNSDFGDLLKHSESVARKLWDNKEDEIWNNF